MNVLLDRVNEIEKCVRFHSSLADGDSTELKEILWKKNYFFEEIYEWITKSLAEIFVKLLWSEDLWNFPVPESPIKQLFQDICVVLVTGSS